MTIPGELAGRRTALYRWHDADGRLLYVGITANPGERLQHHERTQSWFAEAVRSTVEWFETRIEAEAAEVVAVRQEKPLHNVRLTERPPTLENPHPRPRRGGWPGPRKVQTGPVRQSAEQVAQVQAYAERESVTYAEAIRRLVDAGLAALSR